MDNLLKNDLVQVINSKRKKTLPAWTVVPSVVSEVIPDSVFNIATNHFSTLSSKLQALSSVGHM